MIAPLEMLPGPWTKIDTLKRAGGVLHFAELGQGDGPPIVLLHKFGGWLSDWRFVAPRLAARRRVIAFDLPGHGGSRWLGPPPYVQTLAETATLLVGALDEMGVAQVDLVGTSLGGCLSAPLAAFFPERVRRLAIVSAALGVQHTRAEIAENIDRKEKPMFDAAGNPLPTDPALLTQMFGIRDPAQINEEGTLSRKAAGHWLQPSERGVGLVDIQALMRRIEAPTLLLYGDRDPTYVRWAKDAHAALKHGAIQYVPNSGAFVLQENPAATADILTTFLT
jgi:pimeloyl-ACP methyl ester carboxylesterase